MKFLLYEVLLMGLAAKIATELLNLRETEGTAAYVKSKIITLFDFSGVPLKSNLSKKCKFVVELFSFTKTSTIFNNFLVYICIF